MTAAVPDPRFRDQLAEAIPAWVGLTHDEPTLLADALLSGPVAPLLADQAAVKRVEHLYAVLVEGGAVFATLPDLRRALHGPQ